MNENINPTIKDKNLFWASASLNIGISIITAFFVTSFDYLFTNYFNYGFLVYLLFFFDSGLFILILLLFFKKKIVPVGFT